MPRTDTFYSIGLMPALMGLGHLAPTVGAIQAATGSYQFPIRLLVLIGTMLVALDSMDTYKDTPSSTRPSKRVWQVWVYGLWTVILTCGALSGMRTAFDVYRVLPLGVLWGVPCIPRLSTSKTFTLIKPKALLFEAKSLVVALCMALVCADASAGYYCRAAESQCSSLSLRNESFYLTVLYEFFRETTCDVRDIDEDLEEGLKTLPVKLGKRNTMVLMTFMGILLDSVLTHGITFTAGSIHVEPLRLAHGTVRVGMTMAIYWQILRYPKGNSWAWGFMSLLGLVPVLSAQAALRN